MSLRVMLALCFFLYVFDYILYSIQTYASHFRVPWHEYCIFCFVVMALWLNIPFRIYEHWFCVKTHIFLCKPEPVYVYTYVWNCIVYIYLGFWTAFQRNALFYANMAACRVKTGWGCPVAGCIIISYTPVGVYMRGVCAICVTPLCAVPSEKSESGECSWFDKPLCIYMYVCIRYKSGCVSRSLTILCLGARSVDNVLLLWWSCWWL